MIPFKRQSPDFKDERKTGSEVERSARISSSFFSERCERTESNEILLVHKKTLEVGFRQKKARVKGMIKA